MQPSPLQLEELRFINVEVKPRVKPDLTTQPGVANRFRFAETVLSTTVQHAEAPNDEASPVTSLLVSVQLIVPGEGENPAPYVVDIQCAGYFHIFKAAFPDPVKRLDLAVVNGASLLYGAIREQLCTITSRMWYGELLLPSVNFAQNAPSLGGYATNQTSDGEKKPRNPSRKSVKKSV